MKLYIKSSMSDDIQEEMNTIDNSGFDAVRNKYIKEEYFATRKSDEPNKFKVVVEDHPVIRDADGYVTEFKKAPYSVWEASSLEEASDMIRFFIRKKNIGGSTYTGGAVYDMNDNLVAKISYNGRIQESESVTSSTNTSELRLLIRELKAYLRNQPNVENVGVDIARDYMLITVAFSDGTVIDDWDEKLSDIPEDFDNALEYLTDKFKAIK